MAQIFHRSTNIVSKLSIAAALILGAAAVGAIMGIERSPYRTNQGVIYDQPVPFSHDHHTAGLGIDCRYCHTSVETSNFAGIPPTATCMNCHKEIWKDSEMLAPVRESWATGEPLRWNRVYDLPDFVYFDHSIHVKKGVGCESCHGPVDEMPLIYRAETLQMQWCLDCHRAPEKFVRPPEEVFNMEWERPTDDPHYGLELVEKAGIDGERRLTSCSTCHR